MLPKIHRLHLKKDITAVLKKGRRFPGRLTTLFCFPSQQTGSRFGFVVSKKISNKTTKRNLIKRRMRHAVSSRPQIREKDGHDYLFIAKPGILNKSYKELEQEIIKQLELAGNSRN